MKTLVFLMILVLFSTGGWTSSLKIVVDQEEKIFVFPTGWNLKKENEILKVGRQSVLWNIELGVDACHTEEWGNFSLVDTNGGEEIKFFIPSIPMIKAYSTGNKIIWDWEKKNCEFLLFSEENTEKIQGNTYLISDWNPEFIRAIYYFYSEEIEIIVFGPVKEIIYNFLLLQNYPNPFNSSTNITYTAPKQSKVTLAVYNLLGKEVARLVDEVKPAGQHSVAFDASDLKSGVYFYKLRIGEKILTKKMTLIK